MIHPIQTTDAASLGRPGRSVDDRARTVAKSPETDDPRGRCSPIDRAPGCCLMASEEHSRTAIRAVFLVAIMVLSMVAIGVGSFAGTAAADESVEIEHSDGVTFSTTSSDFATEDIVISPAGDDIVIDEDTEFKISNNDKSTTISPEGGSDTITLELNDDELQPRETLVFQIYDTDGEIRDGDSFQEPIIRKGGDSDAEASVEITGDTAMFSEGVSTDNSEPFDTYTVELIQDGSPIDKTSEREIGIGYSIGDGIEQDSTTGEIEFTLPRESRNAGIDEEWDAQFTIGSRPDLEVEKTIDNNDGDDEFTFTIDSREIDSGEYTYRLTLEKDDNPVESNPVVTIVEIDSIIIEDEPIIVDNDGGEDFESIQSAVDDAEDGDTIEVKDGTYEEPVEINKEGLTVTSAEDADPVVRQESDTVITVSENNTIVNGFTIEAKNGATGVDLNELDGGEDVVTLTNNVVDLTGGESDGTGIDASDANGIDKRSTTINGNTFNVDAEEGERFIDDADDQLDLNAHGRSNEFNPHVALSSGNTDIALDSGDVTYALTPTIQEGITVADDVADANNVTAGGGTYEESVTIDVDGLTLEAAEDVNPTVETEGDEPAIVINSDDVTVDGVNAKLTGDEGGVDQGIRIAGSDVTVSDLEVSTTLGPDEFTDENPNVGILVTDQERGDSESGEVTDVNIENVDVIGFNADPVDDDDDPATGILIATQEVAGEEGPGVDDVTITGGEISNNDQGIALFDQQDGGNSAPIGEVTIDGVNEFDTNAIGVSVLTTKESKQPTIKNSEFNIESGAEGEFVFVLDLEKNIGVTAELDLNAILNDQGNTFDPNAVVAANTIVPEPAEGEVLNLDTGVRFTGDDIISAAEDAADPDETLLVGSGTYEESVEIDVEGLTLVSDEPGAAEIDGGDDPAITIEADNVTVDALDLDIDDAQAAVVVDIGDDDSTTIIANNLDVGESSTGVESQNDGAVIDARFNWWGDATGPDGDGAGVEGDVDFRPYLTAELDGDFQLTPIGQLDAAINASPAILVAGPGPDEDAIETPEDTDLTLGTSYSAIGNISADDVEIRLVDDDNPDELLGVNRSDELEQEGTANVTIPSENLTETTTVRAQLFNATSGSDNATNTGEFIPRTVEIEPQPVEDVPDGFPGTADQFTAIDQDGDGELGSIELAQAITENAEEGSVNGIQITPIEFAQIIDWNADQ